MQVVMALVVVSFVGMYGVQSGQDKSQVVASVNGTKIMSTDLGRQYRNRLSQLERQQNRSLGNDQQQQLREQVKQEMIEDEVILQQAHALGLEVSDMEVAAQVLGLPVAIDENGEFSEDLYRRILKRNQYTRPKFEQVLRDDLLRLKLRRLVYTGATLSEPAVREAYVDSQTLVDVEYVRIDPRVFGDDIEVADGDVESWLAENEDVARETYDSDFNRRYNHPEQVRLKMIRFGITNDGVGVDVLLAKMRVIKEEIEAGASFEDMARKWSEDPSVAQDGDLGLRALSQFGDKDKFEGLAPGALTDVVTSDSDVRLYRLEERQEPKIDAFEEVKADIAREALKQEQIPALAAAFAEEQVLPAWSNTSDAPMDLLSSKGLSTLKTGLRSTQMAPQRFSFGPPPAAMLAAARSAEVGEVLPEVFENAGSMYVGQLIERKEADMAEFEANRERIEEQVLMARRNEFYTDWVADLKSQQTIKQ